MSDWWSADPIAGDAPQAQPSGRLQVTVRPQGSQYADAIGKVESGGRYDILGPVTRTGDRAFGKYQVMGQNVGPWTEEILGQKMTPQQFLASPEAQDQVFNAKFGGYAKKYGPEGAAKAWFAGEGGMNDPNRRDILGTSVADYARKFTGAMGPQPAQAMSFAPEQQQQAPQAAQGGNWWASDPIASQQAQPQQNAPASPAAPQSSQLRAGAEGLRSGVSFNFGDEVAGLGAASGLPFGSPLAGAARLGYEYLTGQGGEATKNYERARDEVRRAQEAAQRDHPGTYMAGQIGGAVAMPFGGALNAATLPARIGRGAAVGAGFGAAAGAGEGTTLEDRATRATTGGLIGGAIGAAGAPVIEGVLQAGRAVANPLINAVRGAVNPQNEAARRVAGALQRDMQADPNAATRMTAAEFAASRQQPGGGPATIMDMGGETTRALARSAANTSPEGRAALNQMIVPRYEGQSGRVTTWLNDTFHYPNANAQQQAIDQIERTVNRAAYVRAYRDGDHPLWSAELERLTSSPAVEDALRGAVRSGRDRSVNQGYGGVNSPVTVTPDGRVVFNRGPNGVPTYPNLQFWDNARRELSDAAAAARRAGRNEEAARLGDLSRSLNAELDRLVPTYQQARAGAAHFFGAENALEAGQIFVSSNFQAAATRQALARMSPAERQLFQDGFVSRFIETLNRVGDNRNILNQIANTPAAREKLNIALGPQRAAELEAGLRVEGIMDFARTAVQGNSTTARQWVERGMAGGAAGLGGVGTYNMDPQQITYAAMAAAIAGGSRHIDQRVARQVAQMLVSNDPQQLLRGIRLVARNGRFMDALRGADRSIARIGGQQAPSAGAVQAVGTGRAEDDQPDVQRIPN